MLRKRVSSAEIFAIGYDEEKRLLEVEMLNGSLYQYRNVARMIYEELMHSASKNRYYTRYIKTAFPYEKLR